MRVDIPVRLQLLFETVEENGTSGLVITEVFDDSNKVGADIVLLHVAHKAAYAKPCRRPS